MGSLALAYVAGVVTLLSPCVLPLLPIILYGVLQESKYGTYALAAGLALSFTVFGFLVASVGFAIGLTTELLQTIAGSIMMLFGAILLFAPLYEKFAAGSSALTSTLNSKLMGIKFKGLTGQFLLGALLGLVWAPCVGPTLGAAITLAAQGENLTFAFTTMLMFSLGTVTPIILLGRLSRPAMLHWKTKMAHASTWLKPTMGAIFLTIGLLFITGLMSTFEAWVLDTLPLTFIQFLYQF